MVDTTRQVGPEGHHGSLSGLTEAEAKEFHRYFTSSFLGFLALALVAHGLCYAFAPWGVNV